MQFKGLFLPSCPILSIPNNFLGTPNGSNPLHYTQTIHSLPQPSYFICSLNLPPKIAQNLADMAAFALLSSLFLFKNQVQVG